MDGSDTISGRGGQDGVDFSFENGTHGVVVNLTGDVLKNLAVPGIAISQLGPNSAYDSYGNIDKLSNIEDATGTSFADWLVGNGARNVLRGESGNDYVFGGGGNDWLLGGNGDDSLDGGIGDDVINGGGQNDTLNGGNGDDTLEGDGGDDQLFAGAGNDLMDGGEGDDKLIDGVGKDIFTGSTGVDRFDFNKLSEMGNTAATRDVITDMHVYLGADKIDLATLDANSTAGGDQAFSFIAGPITVFSGLAGELIWSQEDSSGIANDKTVISGDVDGDMVADFQIELTGLVTLTANDFIL
jgi:Ca2+-binding RTX toxin-like protein